MCARNVLILCMVCKQLSPLHRNKSLKEKIKELRRKEAEETRALEEVVQRVEENLVSTTVRHAAWATATTSTVWLSVEFGSSHGHRGGVIHAMSIVCFNCGC